MPGRVSILILACNKSVYTARCLNALLQTDYADIEFILVDNGSSDDTPEVFARFACGARERGWTVRVLSFAENIGAVAGRNEAMRVMTGDYVVFMDNDIVIASRSWLTRLTAMLDADPTIGVLGPKILFAGPPHLIQCAGCVVCRGGRVGFIGRGEERDTPEHDVRREVQCLISACWIMPRRVVDAVGELDMQFHPVQFEDIDYCYRIREAGYQAVYDPSVHVYHFENVTTDGTQSLNYTYLTVKNGLKFKRKWQHVFSKEDGPDDASIPWREIPRVPLEAVGELPIHE